MEEAPQRSHHRGGIIVVEASWGSHHREAGKMEAIWKSSRNHLGVIWEASGKYLGGIWRHLETSGRHLGGIWNHLGGTWKHLGGIWKHLGRIWKASGRHLGDLGSQGAPKVV